MAVPEGSHFCKDYKKILLTILRMNSNAHKNDILLTRYDIRRCRMIYLLRKHDILSVPKGTDIIEKTTSRSLSFFHGARDGTRTHTAVATRTSNVIVYHSNTLASPFIIAVKVIFVNNFL